MTAPDWLTGDVVWIIAATSIAMAVVSILLVGVVLVRLPADYFSNPDRPRMWANRHPFLRWPLTILKNGLGVLLIVLGVLLSLPGVPGQGVLTILMGAMLLDFPGKTGLEKWLLRRRGVLSTINRLRARRGREPLQLDAPAP